MKYDYAASRSEINHRETQQVLRQVNPFDTKDVSGCARRKTRASESYVR